MPSNNGEKSSVSLSISNNDDDSHILNIRIENGAGMKLYEVEKKVPAKGEYLERLTIDDIFEMEVGEQYYIHTKINGSTIKEYSDKITCNKSTIDILTEYEPNSLLIDQESISYTSTTCS
ncbi:hypothetical protein [Halocatena halophila]|uniref:hypothetical protein n=1 Tax=Halocatena halophila TaxID=2814576 RepID=UPI002ED2F4D5